LSRNDEPYELDGSVVLRTSRRAVLVRTDDLAEVWIPKSVCIDGDDLEEGDKDISVRSWWAEQEGIE
jgi:hypothetical protein